MDRFAAHRAAIETGLREQRTDLAPELQQALRAFALGDLSEPDVPEPLRAFAIKTLRNAYKVRDRDVAALRDAGYSEDAIYEAIVTLAAGAGMRRIDAGMAALAQTGDQT
jgi:alkylhydroperoxidase/carboxymuconolactone decarboxylase family protein YurZ